MMVNFIICEDNEEARKIYVRIINKTLMNYDIEYKIYQYEKYNDELKKLIEEPLELKIYIMDLEMSVKDGIQITKEIRKQDWDSQIIILTAHEELELRVLKQRLLIIDFISKFDDYERKLSETIKLIIEKRQTRRTIRIKTGGVIHNVKFDDIIYIEKDKVSKKVKVVTKKKKYITSESLISIEKRLDKRFIRTHRACIINENHIDRIDNKENKIYMYGEKTVEYLSRKYKKDLKV